MSETKWDPVKYNQVADFVARLGEPLLVLLEPKLSDFILDLGCGDGSLTEKIKLLCQNVLGIDASAEMVLAAKAKGINAVVKDAHNLDFNEQFDGVFSNAALHWMTKPTAVLSGIYRALKPQGRFVAEFGGFGNAKKIVDALTTCLEREGITYQNPWYFPSDEAYSDLLVKQGFVVEHIELFDRFTPLPEHLSEWLDTFGQAFFVNVDTTQKRHIIDEITDLVKPDLFVNGQWHVDYVRLRVKALKS
ncbi:MAG: trans-aconitate methyltransferase [Glaciecola sp.]|jgi:trans-aconitate methyltransferase